MQFQSVCVSIILWYCYHFDYMLLATKTNLHIHIQMAKIFQETISLNL